MKTILGLVLLVLIAVSVFVSEQGSLVRRKILKT
jgi:hypothetical protein